MRPAGTLCMSSSLGSRPRSDCHANNAGRLERLSLAKADHGRMRWTVLLAPKMQCRSVHSQRQPWTVLLTSELQRKLGQTHGGLSWAAQPTSALQCKHGRLHEGAPCLVKAILLSQPLGPGQADHLPQVRLLLQDRPRSLPVLLLYRQLSNRLHRQGGAGEGLRRVLQQPASAHEMAAERAVTRDAYQLMVRTGRN